MLVCLVAGLIAINLGSKAREPVTAPSAIPQESGRVEALPAPEARVLRAAPVPRADERIVEAVPKYDVRLLTPDTLPADFDFGPSAKTDDPCKASVADLEWTRPVNGWEARFVRGGEGYGMLEVTNGNSQDAAVILADLAGIHDDRLMYIRSGMQATMRSIPPGQYRIKFQTGKNWDEDAESFLCVYGTAIFDKTESFTEEERADGIEYSRLSITLHKVVGGNARSSPIAKQAFARKRLVQ